MNTVLILCVLGGLCLLASPYLRRDSHVVRALIVTFSLAVTARYFIWRTTSTLPDAEFSIIPVLSYLLFTLEILTLVLQVEDILSLRRTMNRSAQVEQQLDWYGEKPPRVDILIPTYNEPWEVLEKTIVGAQSQNYGNYEVWLLDDGRREWLRDKAAELKVGYLTRANNAHYKAGNLNAGVSQLRERGIPLEYLAVLDADFIAWPDFLRRTAALMKSGDVGIVQTPQFFYNPDPFQQTFGGVKNWPDEQRAWFDVYLPAWDARNCPTCCGTSFLMRIEALDVIGGFPTESISEDTLASIKMRGLGWRTIILDERLAVGLAPEGLAEYLTQRARWLSGSVQIVRHFGAGKGVKRRLRYWLSMWRFGIFGMLRTAWVCSFVLYWFTGRWLVTADFEETLSYFAPFWLDSLFQGWLFGGRRMLFLSEAHRLIIAPLWIWETFWAAVGAKKPFVVTDKAKHRDHTTFHFGLVKFRLVLGGAMVLGLVYTAVDPSAPLHNAESNQLNVFASGYFLLVLLATVAPAVEQPKRRTADRYPTSEKVGAWIDGRLVEWRCRDISIGGALFQFDGNEPRPETVELELEGVGAVRARFVRSTKKGSAAYAFDSPDARPALIRKLYCSDAYVASPTRWGLRDVVGSVFKRLLF